MNHSSGVLPKEFSKSPIVTVRTGTDNVTFFIHSSLICRESKYFEACLKPDTFRESQTKEVTLSDTDPEAFSIIVKYCYTSATAGTDLNPLVRAYATAEKLLMEKCKNTIMDEYRLKFSKPYYYSMDMGDLKLVQELEMPPHLQMRKFIIDKLAFDICKSPCNFHDEKGILRIRESDNLRTLKDSELLKDLLLKILSQLDMTFSAGRNKETQDPGQLKGCVYHDHEGGEKCPATAATYDGEKKTLTPTTAKLG